MRGMPSSCIPKAFAASRPVSRIKASNFKPLPSALTAGRRIHGTTEHLMCWSILRCPSFRCLPARSSPGQCDGWPAAHQVLTAIPRLHQARTAPSRRHLCKRRGDRGGGPMSTRSYGTGHGNVSVWRLGRASCGEELVLCREVHRKRVRPPSPLKTCRQSRQTKLFAVRCSSLPCAESCTGRLSRDRRPADGSSSHI